MSNGNQSKEPVVILALDAADYDLARTWECNNLLLENHASLETFSYTYDHPYTPEVWTSMATGLHPTEHGIHGNNEGEWDVSFLNWLSDIAFFLPSRYRARIANLLKEKVSTRSMSTTNCPHIFISGLVHEWPGITDAPHLIEAWDLIEKVENEGMSERDLFQILLGDLGKKVGWLRALSTTTTPIIGTHVHYLDVAGHVFARHGDRLKQKYQMVNNIIEPLKQSADRLVVLSDHGMQTSFLDDNNPGEHSKRALIATNFETDLPEHVFDVAGWLSSLLFDKETSDDVQIDAPIDHLRNMGYLE